MIKEFREFIMRGNVLDMAVGIIIGVAFGAIINSLVKDVIMPPIGLLLGKVDFANLFVVLQQGSTTPGPYDSLASAQAAGAVSINYGVFINTIINFLIIALVIFLIVRTVNQMRRKYEAPKVAPAPVTKECPFCLSKIPIGAKRCAYCTSQLQT
jgi:large conductance mechanosensitive channel